MRPVRSLWLLVMASLAVLLTLQSPARALQLDLDHASSPTAGAVQSTERSGHKPLPWAVLNTLATELSASAPLADSGMIVWSQPASVVSGSAEGTSSCSWQASGETAGLVEAAFGSSFNDQRSNLPWRPALSGGLRWPVPLTPPSSASEHELEYGLLIPTPAIRPVVVARFAQVNRLFAATPYLGSLFRPPWASLRS